MKKILIYALSWATTVPSLAQTIAPNNTDGSSVYYLSMAATPPESTPHYQPAEAFRQRLARHVTFPDLARQTGAEGTVQVRIRVRPDGIGEEATIIRSAGPILDREVLKAAYAALPWRFTTTPGRRYSVDYPITFRFE